MLEEFFRTGPNPSRLARSEAKDAPQRQAGGDRDERPRRQSEYQPFHVSSFPVVETSVTDEGEEEASAVCPDGEQ